MLPITRAAAPDWIQSARSNAGTGVRNALAPLLRPRALARLCL
jgi:hypothetical protein